MLPRAPPRAPHQPPPRPISPDELGRQGATPSARLSAGQLGKPMVRAVKVRAPSLRDGRRARRHSASPLPCCASPVEVPAGGAAAARRRAVMLRSRAPCRAAVAPFARAGSARARQRLLPGRAAAVEKGERPLARMRGEQPRRSSPRRCGRASRSCSRGVGRERRTAPGARSVAAAAAAAAALAALAGAAAPEGGSAALWRDRDAIARLVRAA